MFTLFAAIHLSNEIEINYRIYIKSRIVYIERFGKREYFAILIYCLQGEPKFSFAQRFPLLQYFNIHETIVCQATYTFLLFNLHKPHTDSFKIHV